MAKAKTFQAGEVVLFRRDTDHGRSWELGEFLSSNPDFHGWYWVRDDTGFREHHLVPSRRIKHSPAPRAEGVLQSSST